MPAWGHGMGPVGETAGLALRWRGLGQPYSVLAPQTVGSLCVIHPSRFPWLHKKQQEPNLQRVVPTP